MNNKTQLLSILDKWNFWSRDNNKAGITRDITPNIIRFISDKQIISLKGVRRSGKSTIFFQIAKSLTDGGVDAKQILYVNFEDPFFAQNNTISILDDVYQLYREEVNDSDYPYIFLDEIQNITQWERWVRTKNELNEAKIFVTGSSSKLLSSELSSVLTGRHISFTIYPLTFKEFLRFKGLEIKYPLQLISEKTKIRSKLKDYLHYGGFPEPCLLEDRERKEIILKQYFEDILFRDIVQRHQIRDVRTLRGLAVHYQTSISVLSSYNKIKNTMGIPIDVIRNYTSYLIEAYLMAEHIQFSYKIREQQMSPKKIYSIDTGLRNCVCFRFSEDIGRLAENAVYNSLRTSGDELYYHKKSKEADFIVKRGLKIVDAIQVTFSDLKDEKVRNREVSGVVEALNEYKMKKGKVVTDDYEDTVKIDKATVEFIPLWKYLLQ